MNARLVSRRQIVTGLTALGLSACGENRLGENVMRAIQLTTTGLPSPEISRERVSNLPYASIAANIGKGPRTLMILWRSERDDRHWLTSDGSALVTRGGRVVRTVGLPVNLRESLPIGEDPVAIGLQSVVAQQQSGRVIDMDEAYGLRIDAVIEPLGPAIITIADIDFETQVFREINRVRHMNWTFVNIFWVDPADGFVWKSQQHFARAYPPLTIEVLKPPG